MKQPNIKISNNIYKVTLIEFDKNGSIKRIVYEVKEDYRKYNRSIFKSNTVINHNLTTERVINEPTQHPYHEFLLSPDLESLLIY